MAYLSYISDEALMGAVGNLLTVAEDAEKNAIIKFDRNVIDPFSALFEMAGFNLPYEEWKNAEKTRQAQKTLSNEIGLFHQHILGSISGWLNLGKGAVVDLVCDTKKIVAEVKNKHNTVKGADKIGVYDTLINEVQTKGHKHFGYTAYLVEVIPYKHVCNKPFTPSDNKKALKRPLNEKIRVIDGRSFYALATGQPDALDQLHNVLPQVIQKCSQRKYKFSDPKVTQKFFTKAFGKNTIAEEMDALLAKKT